MEEIVSCVEGGKCSCNSRNRLPHPPRRIRIRSRRRPQLLHIRFPPPTPPPPSSRPAPDCVDIIDRPGGRRVLQVRNPWSKGGIPHTAFSLNELHDAISETPDLHDDPSRGTFWIDYNTLTQLFKTLYLNWNPNLFPHVRRKHFQFTPTGSDFDVGRNGQYTLTIDRTGEVWILLERHYLGKSEGWEGYIGLAVFPGNERIYSYSRPLFRVLPALPF